MCEIIKCGMALKTIKLHGQVSELISVFPTLFPGHIEGLYYDELIESPMCNLNKFDPILEDKDVRLEEVQ